MRLRFPQRPTPLFLGGHAALDFLNSIATYGPERIDWLATGPGLVEWLAAAGLAPAPSLEQLQTKASTRALDTTAARARELREWWRGFVRGHAGRPLLPSALSELRRVNRLLALAPVALQLGIAVPRPATPASGSAFRWHHDRRWVDAPSLLQPLAEAIGDMVQTVDFRYLRHCNGIGCTLWFADQSRGHQRRWCSMGICGNRRKATDFRARRRSAP